MRTIERQIALFSLAALLLAGVAAAGGSAAPRMKATAGAIEAVAMDGPRVAYDVQGNVPRRCNRVYVWNVLTGVTKAVSGKGTCQADNSSTGSGASELAIAGMRVAWIVNVGGNSESDDYLYTSSLPTPRERQVAFARRVGVAGGELTGNWIGGLVGAGGLLAVDGWHTLASDVVTGARLQRIRGGLHTIASGPETMLARSTDGTSIAVLRNDGSVGLYSSSGALLRSVTLRSATEVALRGDYLAVLTTAGTLEVYNSHSGRRLHTWRVAHGARSLDVSSGLAAYAAPRAGGGHARVVHVLRLSNGKDRAVVTTPPQLIAVRLERVGLVLAVSRIGGRQDGYLAFVPMRRLLR